MFHYPEYKSEVKGGNLPFFYVQGSTAISAILFPEQSEEQP